MIMSDINNYPGLSIVMPNYNGAELLKTFLPDVLVAESNYPGKSEIIVVDDGSMDNTSKIIKDATKVHDWIQSIRLDNTARDLGLHLADIIKKGFEKGSEPI